MLADFVIASADSELIERWRRLDLPFSCVKVCDRWPDLIDYVWPAQSVCLIDLAFVPQQNGLSNVHLLAQRVCVCLSASTFSPEDELQWLAHGVHACCSAQLEDERLKVIIDVTARGGIWVSNQALPAVLQGLQRFSHEHQSTPAKVHESLEVLTPQERKIAQLVGQGESNKLIARALNISDHTVKTHLSAIFSKLHLSDRVHLALLVNQDPNKLQHF